MSTRSMSVAAVHLTYLDEDLRPRCPACNSYRVKDERRRGAGSVGDQLHTCLACGALFGTFARFEDSYQYVTGRWCGCQIPAGQTDVHQVYFDFTGLQVGKRDRRHGWYHPDPGCRRITQTG